MNWAASNLAKTKELHRTIQMKAFYRQKGAGIRKLYMAKNWAVYCKVTFLEETAGV